MKPCDECIKERAEKIHESHVPNIVSALTAVEVMEECHIIMPGEQAERDEMLTATRQELQSELSELERRDD